MDLSNLVKGKVKANRLLGGVILGKLEEVGEKVEFSLGMTTVKIFESY